MLPALAVMLFCSGAVRADILQVSVQSPISAIAGSSGGFDVYLTDLSSNTAGVTIGGFSFELQTSSPDVVLTSASTGSLSPYIFSGNSFVDTYLGGNLTAQTSPDLIALDFAAIPNTGTLLSDGQTLALGRVFFNVSAGAPTENVSLSFVNSFNTLLTDPFGNPLSISSLNGGTMNVTGSTAPVPDGSSWLLLLTAILLVWPRLRSALNRTVKSAG